MYITIHETVNGKDIETTFQVITPYEAANLIDVPQGIGGTHPSFVREVYYPETNSIEISVNNKYSDGVMQGWSTPGAQAPNFNGCLLKYSQATTVIIKEGITKIGGNTEWADTITDIYLPQSLKSIPTLYSGGLVLPKSVTYHVYENSYSQKLLAENGYNYVIVE